MRDREGQEVFTSNSGESTVDYSETDFGATSFGDDWSTGDRATDFRFPGSWSTRFKIKYSKFYFNITVFRRWG
jgi:hypothetical protein